MGVRVFGFEHHHNENPLADAPAYAVEIVLMLALTLEKIDTMESKMSAQLDTLTAQVAANKAVTGQVLQTITALAAQIAENKNDPVALQALADSLKSDDTSLSAAVAANAPVGPPTFAGVVPANGPIAGGITVTITGTNFTGATAVTFGGIAATSFSIISPTSITAVTPAQVAGVSDVVITTPLGVATGTAAYTTA